MGEQSNEDLIGVDEGCVPMSQTNSDESSTSECMMGWIPRLGDRCGQQRVRVLELIVLP